MEQKQSKLLPALKQVITALKMDTIQYDWTEQSSCNCGLAAQAMLGYTSENLASEYHKHARKAGLRGNKDALTWKTLVQHSCPITGIPMEGILATLYESGLTPRDIVHLEYLENPAILKEAGLGQKKNIFGRVKPTDYKSKENLIAYLSAWVRILEKNTTIEIKFSDNEQLEASLLIAVATENYEEATKLRDQLAAV